MTIRHLLSPKCWQKWWWWGRGRQGEEILRALLYTVMPSWMNHKVLSRGVAWWDVKQVK